MGLSCFTASPRKSYQKYLISISIPELKQRWPSINLYKMKKTFLQYAEEDSQNQYKYIPLDKFLQIFPQIKKYDETYQHRLYEFFDYQEAGYLSWSSFYASMSIFYFATEEILSVIMFLIFDSKLVLRLNRTQLLNLIQQNSNCLREDEFNELQDIVDLLIPATKQFITIDEWISAASIYFDLAKFRRVFNLFREEQIQKQLVENFAEWNQLKDEQKGKYIGYVLSYKWFEGWILYVQKNYGVIINGVSTNLTYSVTLRTIKSIKTKKTLKSQKSIKYIKSSHSLHSIKTIRHPQSDPKMRQLPPCQLHQSDGSFTQNSIRNYDLVHSSIGSKPRQIFNNLLEGQFSQMLISELIENVHYMLVSERVWTALKSIYGAYPEFRRTGISCIELYPKTVKIYPASQAGNIIYSQQLLCQISNFHQIGQFFMKVLQISAQKMKGYSFFYKTIGMFKWEQINDLKDRVSQLSAQPLLFIAYVELQDVATFKRQRCVISHSLLNLNIGDQIRFEQEGKRSETKPAIFMGKKENEKYIVHFKGQSYIYDVCVSEEEFEKRATFSKHFMDEGRGKHEAKVIDLIGIPDVKCLGFINGVLLNYFSHQKLRECILAHCVQKPTNYLQALASILKRLLTKTKINSSHVYDFIRLYHPSFATFDFTMCQEFLNQFTSTLSQQIKNSHSHTLDGFFERNCMDDYKITTQKSTFCLGCNNKTKQEYQAFGISIITPQSQVKYYEVVFVPFNTSMKVNDIRRYGFTLNKQANLKQYKQKFQKVSELPKNSYLLAQVNNNNILKNFSNVPNDSLLSDIHLRETDIIYAYELCFRLDEFVDNHYYSDIGRGKSSNGGSIWKIGQMIDFLQQSNKKWMCGQVTQIQIQAYTHKTILTVQCHVNLTQKRTISIDAQKTQVAIFPTQSHLSSDQYHLRALQRIYNEITSQMENCNLPLVIMIASWMRVKEVQLLVYQQIRSMIASQFRWDLYFGDIDFKARHTKKDRLNKFREYLFGGKNGGIPYEIKFTDLEGRCALCFKIQKQIVLPDEVEYICSGCPLNEDIPISWQVKICQLRLCIDWKSNQSFAPPAIRDHSSFIYLKAERKGAIGSLEGILKTKFAEYESLSEELCCNLLQKTRHHEQIIQQPERLTLYISRINEEGSYYKTVSQKQIAFPFESLSLNACSFRLTGLISLEGSNSNPRYLTYLLNKEGEWLEYSGETVKKVKSNVVSKVSAILLWYKKEVGISLKSVGSQAKLQ